MLGILFFIILTIPLIVSSYLGIIDPFLLSKVASAILGSDIGQINLAETNFSFTPGIGFLMIIIAKICNISPVLLEYIPIAGIMFILAIFILAKKIFQGVVIASLITGVLIFRWVSLGLYSIWPHAFGYILFLLFIALFLSISKKKNLGFAMLLLVIFLGIHFFSYNAEIWIISFVVFINLILYYIYRSIDKLVIPNLLILMVVIYLIFNQVIYASYIPKFVVSMNDVSGLTEYYISRLFRFTPPVEYQYIPPSYPLLIILNLTWMLMVIAPIGMIIIGKLYRIVKYRSARIESLHYSLIALAVISMFCVWIVDIISYIPIGAITVSLTRYFVLIAPFVAIFSIMAYLKRKRGEFSYKDPGRIIILYTAILFIISVLIFSLTIGYGYLITSPSKYSYLEPGAEWFSNNTQDVRFIYSDHLTQGEYTIFFAENGKVLYPDNLFNSNSFDHLVSPEFSSKRNSFYKNNYVVIDLKRSDKRTINGGWVDFVPLKDYLGSIDTNLNLNRVYDDKSVHILRGI